jgi:lipopolysaccharide transport system permease protein
MEGSAVAGTGLYRSPLEVFTSGWRNRVLILRLTRREIDHRYRGSLLGITWSLLVPLMLLAVYTFIFSVVFQARWDLPIESKWVFALVLFSGLIVFNVFAEVVNRAPSLVLENVSYVKRVVFPLECLAWVSLLVALFNALVSAVALLLGYIVILGLPPITILLWPVLLVPLAIATLGLCWFLSSLGVYIRDVQQFVPVFVTVLLFTNPVFFPLQQLVDRLPPALALFPRLSPMAVVIEQTRDVLFRGTWPSPVAYTVLLLVAWLIAWLGYMWFCKTRKGFADVV